MDYSLNVRAKWRGTSRRIGMERNTSDVRGARQVGPSWAKRRMQRSIGTSMRSDSRLLSMPVSARCSTKLACCRKMAIAALRQIAAGDTLFRNQKLMGCNNIGRVSAREVKSVGGKRWSCLWSKACTVRHIYQKYICTSATLSDSLSWE